MARIFDVAPELGFMETTFSEDLDGDEMDFASHLVEAVEAEFEIRFVDADVKIKTVGDFAGYLGKICGLSGVEEYVVERIKTERVVYLNRKRQEEAVWQQRYAEAGLPKRMLMLLGKIFSYRF